MRALITGANGFVGKYLSKELLENGYEVIRTDINGEDVRHLNLLDQESVTRFLSECKPDYIFHLAGQAAVGLSWSIPKETFEINVCGTINLIEACHKSSVKSKLIIIGSSDQYGIVRPEDFPICETIPLNPQSPYAISKRAQEEISLLLARSYGLEIVLTRSFNHIGAGQRKGFVVSDFSSQIVEIEAGKREPVISVGNLSARRDFTDVRDVVRAYRLLAKKGRSGEIYNVGSGKAISILEILDLLIKLSKTEIKVFQDPEKLRYVDVPLIVCNPEKIKRDTGWEPKYNISDTLKNVLSYFRDMQ